jgi:hypothetical protein
MSALPQGLLAAQDPFEAAGLATDRIDIAPSPQA